MTELVDICCAAELDLCNAQCKLQASQDESDNLKEQLTHLTTDQQCEGTSTKLKQDFDSFSDQSQQLEVKNFDLGATLTELEVYCKHHNCSKVML